MQNGEFRMKNYKKMIFAILVISVFALPVAAEENKVAGEEEETIIVYDVLKHKETAGNVYMAIGGASIGVGIGVLMNSNDFTRGIGMQNVGWGIVQTGLAIYDKNWAEKETDEEKAKKSLKEDSLNHLWMDLAFMAAGAALLFVNDEHVQGHGMGIIIHSMLLAAYDFVNLMIVSNPEKILPIDEAGAGWNVYITLNTGI